MHRHFIAVTMFEHPIDCFCPDGNHENVLTIHRGDLIELTNERKYTMENGWYFLVVVNNYEHSFYMAIDDLEFYYRKQQVLSILDVELNLNYFQFKINQALDTGDEVVFREFTNKMIDTNELKVLIDEFFAKSETSY